ncbi:MAG: radical SAM protein [Bradymonadales bacterium]|nr:radical SAM protein [Bradymonadales bacterium]
MDRDRARRIQGARDRLLAVISPSCQLCEIRCGADRLAGEQGACGLADRTPVYRRMVHLGEEIELVPSYALWLAGCNFACSYCAEQEAIRPPFLGQVLPARDLAAKIAADLSLSRARVKNLNFVGGEPSLSLLYIADVALALLDLGIDLPPLLLNTNGYLTPEALEPTIDLFDLFLVDFKVSNDRCAGALGMPDRYLATVTRTIRRLARSNREVWVRHLLLPGHIQCCTRQILAQLERMPKSIRTNLMPAFIPFQKGWRSLSPEETEQARELLLGSQLRHKYWDGLYVG